MPLPSRTRLSALLVPLLSLAALPALASSHREAPFITEQPKVDATDFYMFRSYEPGREGFVTLVANYVPLQDPYGGPNYFMLDPDALYEMHVDNNGDAVEDVTFQFRFQNALKDQQLSVGGQMVSIPLIQSGPLADAIDPPTLNVRETYTLKVVRGDRRKGQVSAVTNAAGGSETFVKPVDNIGQKTIPNYASYAGKHVYTVNIPGCQGAGRVFVGQRKDPFVVNLGETFDLVNIAAPAVELAAGAESAEPDTLADKNVTSLIVEVPIACLTAGSETVVGGWTTASLRQGRLLNAKPGSNNTSATKEGGAWVQVSRLGMPLVNEVVIGLKDKDRFNASEPEGDAQFAAYVTNPTLPALVELLFKDAAGVVAPTNFPRADLVAAFLTGVTGLNQPANVKAAEMVRLNTTIAPVAAGSQNRLGVIGGDNAGFPNGRRPGDDVVDIELRVAMGKLCTLNLGCAPGDAPSGALQFTDGAFVDANSVDAAFPYLHTPLPGSPNEANGALGAPLQ